MPNISLTDTASQLAELQRRQRLAEALSAQGAAPIEVQSYKGIQAPISPFSALAKVLQTYMGARGEKKAAEEEKTARQTAREEAIGYVEGMKRTPDIGRFETPVSVEEARQQAAVPALTPVASTAQPETIQTGGIVPTDVQGGMTPVATMQAPVPKVYSDAQPSSYAGPQATVMPGRERTPQERMAMALQAQMSGNEYAAAATKPEYDRAVAEAADQAEVQRILENPAVANAPKEVKDKLTLISALGSTALKSAVGKMFEPEETTSVQKDYKAAVDQGYTGSFMDYVQFANPKTIAVTAGGQVFDTRDLTGSKPSPTTQPTPTAGAPAASAPTSNVPSIVKNNNPGALEYRPWMKKYGAVVSEDGRFAKFPTPEAGIQAQTALITNDYVGKGINTIDAIVDKYLGKGSENSFENRSGYKTYLVQKTGLPLGQQVTAADIPKLTEAMRQFETGQRAPTPTAAPAPKGPPKPLIAVPPKPEKPEAPTAAEQSSGYNIGRILRAAVKIKNTIARTPSALAPNAIEAAVGAIPILSKGVNFTRSEDRQIVSAAQRDMVDALLWLSTGAASSKDQREGQIESYLPAFSDKPGAQIAKNERFNQLILDAKTRAGKAWTPELEKALNSLFGPMPATSAKPVSSAKPSTAPASSSGKSFKFNPKTGKVEEM